MSPVRLTGREPHRVTGSLSEHPSHGMACGPARRPAAARRSSAVQPPPYICEAPRLPGPARLSHPPTHRATGWACPVPHRAGLVTERIIETDNAEELPDFPMSHQHIRTDFFLEK